MAEPLSGIDRELGVLEAELKRLEAEYNMFFAGRLPRPPWETRTRVSALMKQIDRAPLSNYAHRYRFSTLQSRFSTFVELWDRGLRAREEGRGGPFGQRASEAAPVPPDRTLHVATLADPEHEREKLKELYDRMVEARRAVGQDSIPYQKFATLVNAQVSALRQQGNDEVAFRVAVKDGKVAFTARPMKRAGGDGEKP